MSEQTIDVPLHPGSRISLLGDLDVDDGGFSGAIIYEGTVNCYNPDTKMLDMEDDDTSYIELCQMIDEAECVQIIQ